MKKLLAMLLILALMLSLTPAAFADETPEETAPIEEQVEEPVEEPIEEPVEEPTEEPAEEPTEEPVEEPSEEPAEDPADDPAEVPAPGTDKPAEQGDPAGQDGDVPGTDDGPEYGVQPAEEQAAEEKKPAEQQEDAEAPEEQNVLVRFRCEPPEAAVAVYDGNSFIGTVTGGAMLLAPGGYAYDASCDGYYSHDRVSFTVYEPGPSDGAQPEQTVTVELIPEDEGGFFEEGESLPLRTAPPEALVVLPVEPNAARRTPTVFLQEDARWAASPYGYLSGSAASTIAASGCGILSLTNAVYYLNGIFIEPSFAAEYAAGAGFHVEGGTKWDFYRGFAQTYGASCGIEYAGEVTSYAELKNMLLRDCVAICSVPGHIMALVDYDEALGRFLLLDSAPDDLRATGAGYVWISEQELSAMPSRIYDYSGLLPRFVLLRAVGILDVSGLLDGVDSDTLEDYGTFDVWIDGDKVANDQADYRAVLRRGASYRIDDVRAKGAHRWYAVQEGSLEGSIRSGTEAQIVLSFGTRDYVSESVSDDTAPLVAENRPPAVCAHWAGGVIGPALTLPHPGA